MAAYTKGGDFHVPEKGKRRSQVLTFGGLSERGGRCREDEEWRPVPGFEGLYEVSNLGRVRSLDRGIHKVSKHGTAFVQRIKGRVLQPGCTFGGYLQYHLYDGDRKQSWTAHALVLTVFVGPRPHGAEGMHLDHDKQNNAVSNLRWGTRQENERQKQEAGRVPRGEESPTAVLTEADVAEIRRRRGEPQKDLADEFGCTFSNISAIQLGKSWRHV